MRALGGALYALAGLSAVAAAAIVIAGPDWIERLTGASPDGGDGSLELVWALAPMAVAVGLAALGRRVRARAAAR